MMREREICYFWYLKKILKRTIDAIRQRIGGDKNKRNRVCVICHLARKTYYCCYIDIGLINTKNQQITSRL